MKKSDWQEVWDLIVVLSIFGFLASIPVLAFMIMIMFAHLVFV